NPPNRFAHRQLLRSTTYRGEDEGLDDSHGPPRGDLPPCSSPCQSRGARQLQPPSPSCPQGALSGEGPCALAVTERMKETVSCGNSGTGGHVQPEARANTSDGVDRQCSRLRPSEQSIMITMPGLAAEALGAYLANDIRDRFGVSHARLAEIIPFAARLALECIGNSDALYHNVEHTVLVTLVGYDIMRGRALLTPTCASDFAHVLAACLFHDIGLFAEFSKGTVLTAMQSTLRAEKQSLSVGRPMPR